MIRIIKIISITLVAILTSALLAEGALQLSSRNAYRIWRPGKKITLHPNNEITPGITGKSVFKANLAGLRADESADKDAIKILVLGGSTTECLFLNQDETWPHLIQSNLNKLNKKKVWVANAGKSGTTSRHHLLQTEKLLKQHKDFNVVLLMIGLNDMLMRLAQDSNYMEQKEQDRSYKLQLLSEAFEKHPNNNSPSDSWIEKSALVKKIRELKNKLKNPQDQRINSALLENYTHWRNNRRSASEIIEQLPNLKPALKEFVKNLKNIISTAKELKVKPVLVTQTAIWDEHLTEKELSLLWMGGIGKYQTEPKGIYYSPSALKKGLKLYNTAILETCRETKISCIDISDTLPNNSKAFYDDVHFNENGSQLIAENISDKLAPIIFQN